jgi:hypothetical protein
VVVGAEGGDLIDREVVVADLHALHGAGRRDDEIQIDRLRRITRIAQRVEAGIDGLLLLVRGGHGELPVLGDGGTGQLLPRRDILRF